MQTPPDIPEAVKMMRELGIIELTVSTPRTFGGQFAGDETVTIKLGPEPSKPNLHPNEKREPTSPLSMVGGSRLRLRPTQADATKAPVKDPSDEPGTR